MAVTPENVDSVRKIIKEDQYVTYREIVELLGISKTWNQKSLHEGLCVKNLFPIEYLIRKTIEFLAQ